MLNVNKKIIIEQKVMPVVILALLLLLVWFYCNIHASAAGSSYHHDINAESWVEMKDGTITISMTSYAARPDTAVRYQTIGFGVSLVDQPDTASANGRTGPSDPANVNEFMLSKAQIVDKGTKNGWNTTWFIFSDDYVYDILGDKLTNISDATMIYF